jgi:hypothetical protein
MQNMLWPMTDGVIRVYQVFVGSISEEIKKMNSILDKLANAYIEKQG